jgi:branched-chain amino acid transport system permease protein
VEGKNLMGVTSLRLDWKIVGIIVLGLIIVVYPWTTNPFRVRVFTLWGIYAIATTGLTLFMGFTGQISIAQGAFFGIGAYASGVLTKAGIPFVVSFFASGLITALIGFVVGFACLRARTFYLAMATLAFLLIMHTLFKNLVGITGGVSGLGGIPPAAIGPFSFAGFIEYYYLVWVIVALVIYFLHKLTRSYIGLTFQGIGNNELAAESLGANAYMFRIFSFSLCSFLAGIAGCLYAHLDKVISYESFSLEESIIFLTMAVMGGLKSIYGGLIGAMVFTLIGEQLRAFERAQIIIVGLMLIALVIFLPYGVVSLPDKVREMVSRARSNTAT